MTPNDDTRASITTLLDEILAGSAKLWAQGIDPGHAVDRKLAAASLRRMTERAYNAPAETDT